MLPFMEEPNPLLSTLGALSNILGPKVAAAAAQSALQGLVEGDLTAGDALNPEARMAAVLAAAKQGAAAADGQQLANGVGVGQDGDMNGVEAAAATADEDSEQQQQNGAGADPDPSRPIDRPLVASAVAAALLAAARRAKQLATAEEREIQRHMVGLTHDAAKRVDAKVNLLLQLMDPPVRVFRCCFGRMEGVRGFEGLIWGMRVQG
jgi:SWI/SNF related-matrix-associated actin-dependent regulator of chromatin subfamily C